VKRIGVTLLWILAALLAFIIVAPRLLVTRDEPARASVAKSQIEQLAMVLDTYHRDVRAYPTEEQGLHALRPYMQKEIPGERPSAHRLTRRRQPRRRDLQ
jgi:type II secretory pathway pseudopilin PulG